MKRGSVCALSTSFMIHYVRPSLHAFSSKRASNEKDLEKVEMCKLTQLKHMWGKGEMYFRAFALLSEKDCYYCWADACYILYFCEKVMASILCHTFSSLKMVTNCRGCCIL